MRNPRFVVAMALFAALVQGCGGPSNVNTSTPRVLTAVSVTPLSPNIAPGTTLQLRAVATYSTGVQLDVTSLAVWNSANGGVATVNSMGVASAVTAGSTAITAAYGGHSGSTVLTASNLLSISITPPNPTIARGTTEQFAAAGTLQNAGTQNLTTFATWSSTDTGIATINSAGLALAGTVATGTTTITATFSSVTGTTSLITAPVTSIAVTPAIATIVNGATQQFAAAGTLGGGATQNLTTWATWTSSNPAVATVSNTSGSKGLAVSVSPGTTQITAAFDGQTSNNAALTVSPATLSSLAVSPTSTSVPLGAKPQFTAIGTYSDNTTQDLRASATWASSNTAVATIAGAKGLATTIATGTTRITASFSGKTSNQATLTVTPAVLVSIDITPAKPSVSISTVFTEQFKATGNFSDGTTPDLTSTAVWSSSNSNVATMSTLVPGLARLFIPGTTTISAMSGTITGSTMLTVTF